MIWKQTTDYTCGPSCLMVSLHEREIMTISKANEIKLWNQINPSSIASILKSTVGTPPFFLQKYIRNNLKIASQLYIFKKNYTTIKSSISKQTMYYFGCLLHDFIALIYQKSLSILFVYKQQTPDTIQTIFEKHPTAYILQNIIVRQTVVHYVLIKKSDNNQFALLDPEVGEWEYLTLSEMNNYQLFGYCIVILD